MQSSVQLLAIDDRLDFDARAVVYCIGRHHNIHTHIIHASVYMYTYTRIFIMPLTRT